MFFKYTVISGQFSRTHLCLVSQSHSRPLGLLPLPSLPELTTSLCVSQTAEWSLSMTKDQTGGPPLSPPTTVEHRGCWCCPSMARRRKVLVWKHRVGDAQSVSSPLKLQLFYWNKSQRAWPPLPTAKLLLFPAGLSFELAMINTLLGLRCIQVTDSPPISSSRVCRLVWMLRIEQNFQLLTVYW